MHDFIMLDTWCQWYNWKLHDRCLSYTKGKPSAPPHHPIAAAAATCHACRYSSQSQLTRQPTHYFLHPAVLGQAFCSSSSPDHRAYQRTWRCSSKSQFT
uniref:Uncharacterized protein MANES_04G014300 n=1 Tax=Rhizophora mucronata TaxID=61149 RepID=A0A2P2IJF3_RHIMU